MAINDSKRYYWVKLKKDFFQKYQIKALKALPNGRLYALIYLELIAESVSHGGKLRFSEMIPYDNVVLAAVIDEDPDAVKSAIEILRKLELLEILDDKTIYLHEVEMLMGSETGQTQRKNLAKLNNGGKNYPELTQNLPKRLEIRDKRLDIEEEYSEYKKETCNVNKNTKLSNQTVSIYELYEKNIAALTPIIGEKLRALVDEVGEPKVREAIVESATHNKRSMAYIEAVAKGKGQKAKSTNRVEEVAARIRAERIKKNDNRESDL